MADLIERESAIEAFEYARRDVWADYGPEYGCEFGFSEDKAREILKDIPAVDAVPVVRCKDCKHFNLRSMECENEAVSTDHEGGASYSLNFYLDDFCSYGERRNNDAPD